MPVLTPSTVLSRPLVLAAYLVAASTKFQELCSVANAEEARQRVYLEEAEDSGRAPRPRAIVGWNDDFSVRREARNSWDHTGSIVLSIELLPDDAYRDSFADEQVDMCDKFGLILEQMRDLAGQGESFSNMTHLNVNEFVIAAGPAECDVAEHDGQRFYGMVLQLRWAN